MFLVIQPNLISRALTFVIWFPKVWFEYSRTNIFLAPSTEVILTSRVYVIKHLSHTFLNNIKISFPLALASKVTQITGDFLHRTFEHRPNQTLDIYVYNTTTYDEGTHLGRHIALNPLPFLTIKTTWQKDSFCPKTAKCWFKIRVTRITLQKRIQEYYDTTILVLFFPEFKRDKGYAS